jgi:hypothetical protein
MPKQIITITGVKALGLQLRGSAPAFSNKGITKAEINQWYYVDNVAAGISAYPDNRVLTYDEVMGATFSTPATQFYQYDVTRSSIPNSNGGFFTYKATDGTTPTILQNTPGYVGRYCMEEGSFTNNQSSLYSISLAGICYPSSGNYPQPYLTNCNLYFNNLGTYTIEDVKIYQLTTTDNSVLNALTLLGSGGIVSQATLLAFGYFVPGLGTAIAIWSFVAIGGGVLYGQGSKIASSLRYIGTGAYTNGSVSLSTVGTSQGTNQYYIAYKVKTPQGFYPITFGYDVNQSKPPGLTSFCAGGINDSPIWTSQGYTTCVSCNNYTVYKDTNVFSSSFNKYKVNDVVGTLTAPANAACDTASNYSTVHGYTYSCSNGTVSSTTVYKNSNPCFTGNQYKIGTTTYVDDPSQTAPSTSPNWVFQYYNCSGCTTRDVERDMNECSSTYLGYTVNHGVNVGTTAPTDTGACNTSQIWTDTGITRCNDCVNEKEQEQTNSCATEHTTKRWVAGGSACSTAQVWTDTGVTRCNECVNEKEQEQTNDCAAGFGTTKWVAGGSACNTAATWVVAFGVYECEGCTQYFVEINNNPCSSTVGATRRGGVRFETTTNCGVCCGESTAPIWTNMDPTVDYYCQGTTKYYKQVDTNPCSPTNGTAFQQGVVYEYESADCGYTGPTYFYYTGIMCGSNIVENFRSSSNLGDGGDFIIYGYTSITGNYQCFSDVTRTTTSNSNDILSTHDTCFDCENYPH